MGRSSAPTFETDADGGRTGRAGDGNPAWFCREMGAAVSLES